MGCDIHLIVQVRRDGVWEDVVLNLDEEVEHDEYGEQQWALPEAWIPELELLCDECQKVNQPGASS